MKAFVSTFGATGHVFPALALSRRLRDRGFEIWFETLEQWRDPIEEMGFHFVAAPEYVAFPEPLPGMPAEPTLTDVVRSQLPLLGDLRPEVVINDFFTVPASLSAELLGLRHATLVPHPYPVNEPGLPYFMVGLLPPRTPVGSAAWRAARPWFARRAQRERRELNEARAELGLPPADRLYSAISEELAMVATFPQLEYPRDWPAHVHVTGPMFFELPHPEMSLPEGDEPLVLVAGSTGQDEGLGIVETALEGLDGEPLRVLAALNRPGTSWSGSRPANATIVEWASYSQVLPQTSVIVSNGGHGTVARALSEGVPMVIRPAGGDMGENGARVAWTRTGLTIPRPLFGPASVRAAVRRVLADESFRERAQALAAWSREHDGADLGADLVERFARS